MAAERAPAGDDALVIFTPSGRRGRFADGTTVLDAARSLGVDIDSVCGGRGICGRCQVDAGRRRVPEARHHVRGRAPVARSPSSKPTYRDRDGPRRGPPPRRARAQVLRRRPDRRPAREPGPSPGRPQGRSTSGLHGRSGRAAPLRRGHAAGARVAAGDLVRLFEALEREWDADRSRGRPRGRARSPAGASRQAGTASPSPSTRRTRSSASGPGLHETALRRRDRRRLHDDRRAPRATSPTARSSPATA